MRKVSIRDFHNRTSELVRDAAAGDIIVIERRGEPDAELGPVTKQTTRTTLPELTDLWNSLPLVAGNSGRFLEEDR